MLICIGHSHLTGKYSWSVVLSPEMKLMHGDELRIRYMGELHKPWSGVGHVIKIPDSILVNTLKFLTYTLTNNMISGTASYKLTIK